MQGAARGGHVKVKAEVEGEAEKEALRTKPEKETLDHSVTWPLDHSCLWDRRGVAPTGGPSPNGVTGARAAHSAAYTVRGTASTPTG